MGKYRDYTGCVVNGMRILGRARDRKSVVPYWKCICVCGDEVVIRRDHLENGSRCFKCGMASMRNTRREKPNVKHAMSGTPEYRSWSSMKARCTNPNAKLYHRYGGRGIVVCSEWMESFEAFFGHIGPRPSQYSLERIDNDKGYEPGNVKWATRLEQQNNRAACRIVVYAGKQMTVSQAIRLSGLPNSTVRNRLYNGWSEHRALTEPVKIRQRA